MASTPYRQDYQIAIICALETEANAVQGIFDEIYETKNILWQKSSGDQNTYTTGRIGKHHVVLAHMPGMGKVNAAITASSIRTTFPSMSQGLALVVGLCGGASQTPGENGKDIYLGDIVISTDIKQADFGREHPNGFIMKDHLEGNLGAAPVEIQSFLSKMKTLNAYTILTDKTAVYSAKLLAHSDIEKPTIQSDKLFPATYLHKHQDQTGLQCQICSKDNTEVCSSALKSTCTQLGCTSDGVRPRAADRSVDRPTIFFGSICSSDAVKRNGETRDKFMIKHKVLAFEMEAAGVWTTLPTLVVKAVCDYADSHKNKRWQEFAAINAAACSKALIEEWLPKTTLPRSNSSHIDHLPEKEFIKIRKTYLDSLDFDRLGARYHDIDFAYHGTCEWVLESTEFKSWLNKEDLEQHHGVLWIKAKPGAGKSVLMKHIYQARKQFTDFTTAAYFFHARGSTLQKSSLGLYRSLLHQLLHTDSNLLRQFINAFPQRNTQKGEHQEWTIQELQHFILLSVRQGWITQTLLIIDALDECEESAARELVSFCEDLTLNALSTQSRLLICFSIRHFPNISMRYCVQISLEDRVEHDRDIEKYISSKIHCKDLVPSILRKARHVFLWAVIVTQILNRLHDSGASVNSMTQQLALIPDRLHDVFDLLIQADQPSSENTVLMLHLVLFTSRPLSPWELYELYFYAKSDHQREDGRLPQDESLTEEGSWRFILTVSRGMLEHEAPKYSWDQHKVQFIHESVRDYLMDLTAKSRSQKFKPLVFDYNEVIAQGCLKAMSNSAIKVSALTDNYAKFYLLDHIVGADGIDKTKVLLRTYAKCLQNKKGAVPLVFKIIDYQNALRRHDAGDNEVLDADLDDPWTTVLQPGYSIQNLFEMTTMDYESSLQRYNTLKHIKSIEILGLVLADSQAMVLPPDWSMQSLLKTSILAAIYSKWVDGFASLLKFGTDMLPTVISRYDILKTIILQLSCSRRYQNGAKSCKALRCMADILLGESGNRLDTATSSLNLSPLDMLAVIEHGYLEAVGSWPGGYTSETSSDHDTFDRDALYAAIARGDAEICDLLACHGVSLESWDRIGGSPLAMAIFCGETTMARTFLDHGADSNAFCWLERHLSPVWLTSCNDLDDFDSETILNVAILSRQPGMVALLLDHGANPYLTTSRYGPNAFQAVSRLEPSRSPYQLDTELPLMKELLSQYTKGGLENRDLTWFEFYRLRSLASGQRWLTDSGIWE